MIYLSICIPTYNRSVNLYDTIKSIISQSEFIESDEIEIVVSDNCSTDNTEEMMEQFLVTYPTKIKYHRNEENIIDRNFEKVLSLGSGSILKLNNDTLTLNPGSLKPLLKVVKYCVQNNLIPFLLNGVKPKYKDSILCTDISSFISTTSYWSTWIGGFCISKKSFQEIENFSQKAPLKLVQVDVLMRLLNKNEKILVIPDRFSTSISPEKKGGYNLPQVFLTNYFKILGGYFINENEVKVLKKEKSEVLFKFILPWLVNLQKESIAKTVNYTFDSSNYKKIVREEFSYLTYLYFEALLLLKFSGSYVFSLIKTQ